MDQAPQEELTMQSYRFRYEVEDEKFKDLLYS